MSKGKGKGVWTLVIVVVAAVIVCGVIATVDSCKRLNRPCFGSSQQK